MVDREERVTPGARAWFVAIVAMAVAGCATRPPERIPYHAEARRDAVRIVILEPAPPVALVVIPGASQRLAAAAGGYGGILLLPLLLAAAADEAVKSKTFTQAAVDAGFDPRDTLAKAAERRGSGHGMAAADRLRAALGRRLPAVERVERCGARRPVARRRFRARDRPSPPAVANASVRLVEPRSHVILYRDTVSFGLGLDASLIGQYGGDLPIGLVAEDKHRFSDFAALVARKEEAFDALRGAARVLAGRIAFDLAPP